ncbi:PhoX family phosphatase [Kovacikia minuta CCNUW1]|uniref:PhoX family protein n=1 Tax=Kovacikia minuta TaxID=2931930 RepID=UPI001CCE7B99|nr:PhoX family phosphatase [Kovacikia minuta]UBF28798.1 PhoX family phosphatase [Kovacikia minuta CCNUW1]
MSKLTRRQILTFFGSSIAATALAPSLERKLFGGGSTIAEAAPLSFTPVRLPHPLPIYRQQKSFLPTGIGVGEIKAAANDVRLSQYNILDDVVVPPEYERYLIVSWGDRVFPNKDEYFGYNCDYTGFVGSANDGYLWVNHEYVSFPISRFAPEAPEDVVGSPETGPLVIPGFPTTKNRELLGEFLYNMGGSVVRISRADRRGKFAVVSSDPKNRRIHGLSGLKINRQRSDGYQSVTSWGSKSYQQGNENYLTSTGPAANEVFNLSSDGLGKKIIGTGFNCSGGTSPWGTILSAEENFQGSAAFFVGVTETVKPDGTQTAYSEGTTGTEFGLVGEKYGWIVEIDPANPGFRPRKHTWLGRFRHENIALRVQAGKRLVAYMGDDRRGGHTWKFISTNTVSNPKSKSNSALFENGTLYVAKFNPNGTGQWIPLRLNSPTNPIPPSTLASVELAALGSAQRNGRLVLPRRNGIAGQTTDGGFFNVDTTNEATALPDYQGKKLSDFYTSQGAILCDCYPAGNLVGGTPTARPEDIEINPRNQREVFISYTDGAPGSDGYPDSRIFVVAKYSAAVNETQQSGGLYKIIEDSADSTGTTFRWQRFEQGGEAGSKSGGGFGNLDNLVFDNRANVWGVTDMSTGTHNGFNIGAAGTPNTIDHTATGNVANLTGVFGNNWLFYIPTSGQHAGEVVPFAYGPPRCEMTGPTFVGNTLIISVQHPGEDCPFSPKVTLSREIEILNLNGTLFNQNRSVPRGSNWPSNIEGNPDGPPKPSVIGIRRKGSSGQFV